MVRTRKDTLFGTLRADDGLLEWSNGDVWLRLKERRRKSSAGLKKQCEDKNETKQRAAAKLAAADSVPPTEGAAGCVAVVTCDAWHVLELHRAPAVSGAACDCCHQPVVPGSSNLHGCRECDYDLCDACFDLRVVKLQCTVVGWSAA